MPLYLDIVAPVYNESEGITHFVGTVHKEVLGKIPRSRLILVDDGSTDDSWNRMLEASKNYPNLCLLKLSRNVGHQKALLAGLRFSDAERVAIIDSDLQDNPKLIIDMLKILESGYEIVYGKRLAREGENLFKKVSAKFFYRFFKWISHEDIPLDTGDFRVVTRLAVDEVLKIRESTPFFRGNFASIGLKSAEFPYNRSERYAGHTKYSLSKMIALASTAVFSFSDFPLKIALRVSITGLGIALLSAGYVLLNYAINQSISGWASLFIFIVFFGSLNVLLLSLVGYYVLEIWRVSRNSRVYTLTKIVES